MSQFFTPDHFRVGVGIEDTFIPHEAIGHRKLDEYELTQHYHYWRDDLSRAADAGASFVRWGIPWYLLEPKPGEFVFDWLDEVAEHMQALNLHCVVDLIHYGTPLWLTNTFLNPDYPERVSEYAHRVAERYGEIWTSYTPLNEPMTNVIWCGRDRRWPPYLDGDDGLVSVLGPIAEGMVRTHEAIVDAVPDAQIVHVDAGFRWKGAHFPYLPHDVLNEWRFVATDLYAGRVDSNHPMADYLARHGMSEDRLQWLRDRGRMPHIMGVNYYPGFSSTRFEANGRELPVEAGTEGLIDMVTSYWERYKTPIVITETSRNDSPEAKQQWLHESFATLDDLQASGIDLRGYTWFPFFSLIDWGYRDAVDSPDAHWNHLGLIDLERKAGTDVLARVPTAALSDFAQICATRHGTSG